MDDLRHKEERSKFLRIVQYHRCWIVRRGDKQIQIKKGLPPQAEGGKDKDNVVAEYSLEEVSQPIGIAGYELSNALSKEYQRSLPTIETLESEVAKMMDIK